MAERRRQPYGLINELPTGLQPSHSPRIGIYAATKSRRIRFSERIAVAFNYRVCEGRKVRRTTSYGGLAAPCLQVADFHCLHALIRWLPRLFGIPA
ncbi:hypothetical protein CTTA_5139 [Comamonas testosteroni]|uniref:Uncharacterized protein n=1 Tax=Comamonas testosteroni TaxID=285 RepID=A0A5A7MMX2_COMTE|nr:hypothetical protein CTTA_5139 [Comamonas testosteroni]